MSEGWRRPGGPPEITFEIPLTGEGEISAGDGAPARPPTTWRKVVAVGALAGAVLGLAAAAGLLSSDGEDDATTTLPDDPAAITTPPTLPRPAAPPPPTAAPTTPPRAPPTLPPPEPAIAAPPPTFPEAIGVPANVSAEFDLHRALAGLESTPFQSTSRTEPASGSSTELGLAHDPVSQRDLLTITEDQSTLTAIADRVAGHIHYEAVQFDGMLDPQQHPDIEWIRFEVGDDAADIVAELDLLRLGPVHAGNIDRATAIEAGPVMTSVGDDRPGVPLRYFHVTMPADSLAGTLLALYGLSDPAVAGVDDVVYEVLVSEHKVEQVSVVLIVGGERLRFTYRTEPLDEHPVITLPDPATVIDASELDF